MRRRIPLRSALTLVAATTALACSGPDAGTAGGVTVTDSAGVTTVQIDDLAALTLPERAATTSVEIGRRAGSELFRVSAGRLLADGGLALGNDGTSEVLYVDRAGEIVRRVGGAGEGPGEFGSITSFPRAHGDTLTVYDVRLGRLTILDPAGDVVQTRPLPPPNRAVDLEPLIVDDDGRVLAVFGASRIFQQDGVRRDTVPLLLVDSASTADTLGLWPGRQWSFVSTDRGAFRTEFGFGRSLEASGRDGRVVIGSTDRLALTVVDGTGDETLRIEGSAPNRPVPEDDVAAWRADRVDGLPEDLPASAREAIETAPYNETYPAFSGLLLDGDGRIWIGEPEVMGADERRWTALAQDGTPRFRVTLPASAEPLDAAGDRLVVLDETELGEEIVRILTLGAPEDPEG